MEIGIPLVAAVSVDEPFSRSRFNEATIDKGPFENLALRGYEFDHFVKLFEEVLQFRFNYTRSETNAESVMKLIAGEVDIIVNPLPIAEYFGMGNVSENIRATQVVAEDNHHLVYRKVPVEQAVSALKLFSMDALFVCIGYTVITAIIKKFARKNTKDSPLVYVVWLLIVTVLLGLFTNLMAVRLVIPNRTTKPYVDVTDLASKVARGECKLRAPNPFVISAISWKFGSQLQSVIHLTKVGIGRTAMIRRILGEKCTIGIDFDLSALYEKQSCQLGSEQMPDANQALYVYLYNKLNMTKKMVHDVDAVVASRSIFDTYEKTKKLFFNILIDAECDPESDAEAMQLSLTKLGDPFIIILVGLTFAVIVCGFEKAKVLYNSTQLRVSPWAIKMSNYGYLM